MSKLYQQVGSFPALRARAGDTTAAEEMRELAEKGKKEDLRESQEGKDEVNRCENCNHPEGAHTRRAGKSGLECSLCDCSNYVGKSSR